MSDIENYSNSPIPTPSSIGAEPTDADLTALAALSTTGLVARTGSATYSTRTITGTANKVTVSNGDGVSGSPTLTIPDGVVLVTPALGTPASGTLSNCTGLPAAGVTGTAATGGGTCSGTCSNTNTGDQTFILPSSSFRVTTSVNGANITGDATAAILIFDSASHNTGSHYDTSTGKYTAPATGLYQFNVSVLYQGFTLATHTDVNTYFIRAGAASESILLEYDNSTVAVTQSFVTHSGSMTVSLTSGDTFWVRVAVSSGTKTVDVSGWFSGFRVG